jgi:hypothetical protein
MSEGEMETHILTFASVGIRNGWIEITAKNEAIARAWASKEYGRWSDTTPKRTFLLRGDAAFYPLGCLGTITLHHEDAAHV